MPCSCSNFPGKHLFLLCLQTQKHGDMNNSMGDCQVICTEYNKCHTGTYYSTSHLLYNFKCEHSIYVSMLTDTAFENTDSSISCSHHMKVQ